MIRTGVLFAVVIFIVAATPDVSSQIRSSNVPDLSFGELIKNKDRYIGKTVRLHAIWTYGFEWTYLCDMECKNVERVWVEVADDEDLCNPKGGVRRKLGTKFDNRAEVIVTGRLDGHGGYGHMGMYPSRFVVTCFEKYRKIY
jgi:hypothetical protein